MPTRRDTNFARPTDADEFESLIRDICALVWQDPHTEKFGRSGQKQMGVDVLGHPIDARYGVYRGAQCKLRTKGDQLSEKEIEHEVTEARSFPHRLDRLIIVTDALRDTHTQLIVDKISEREVANGGFPVVIWFWDNVTERLATYPKLIIKYYADYFVNLTTRPPIVENLVGKPLSVATIVVGDSHRELHRYLTLRGIRLTDLKASTPRPLLGKIDPDGLLFEFSPTKVNMKQNLQRFVTQLWAALLQIDFACPAFIFMPPSCIDDLYRLYEALGGELDQIETFSVEDPIIDIAHPVFQRVFENGYARRGAIPTIEVTFRSGPTTPDSTLLDVDWTSISDDETFPPSKEWHGQYDSALKDLVNEIGALSSVTRIQIESVLQLPAAIAVGFHFNLRFARVGVWARRSSASDYKSQFWLSNNAVEENILEVEWFAHTSEAVKTAIVEFVTTIPIHETVENFVNVSGIENDLWLQAGLSANGTNITESIAIAYANGIGRLIRQLNSKGVADIHLFARMPSALAVLVGQRLQACGRIHLYWFDNSAYSYTYAFTLS
ncbi:MAG: SAVED domain-containing protein [Candidatus Lokiarchaeota archaeon]|nr:SAVED domain-containing protein [Candidatus Lokiarchaeota archaeon]